MDINEYSRLAIRTSFTTDMVGNACFGIGGEAGEILDIVKKHRYHGKELDLQELHAEIGDLVWYVNQLILATGTSWDTVLRMNIAKLEARYPAGTFDPDRANNRDTEAEARAMADASK